MRLQYRTPNFERVLLFKDFPALTLFPDNSFFHQIGLKLDGQLDYEVMQLKLFRGYSAPNFDRLFKDCHAFHFKLTPPIYSFHLIKLLFVSC